MIEGFKETEIGLIPENWNIKSLPDILSNTVDNRGKSAPLSATGIPLIATNCIKETGLYPTYEKIRFVSKDVYDNWFRDHPKTNDIIIVNKGTPGLVCLVPNPVNFCIAQDMIAIRANEKKIYFKFLFAYLRSPFFKHQVDINNVGTTIPHLKKTWFSKLFIPIPSYPEQKFIGDLYYNLCKKIDLNQKKNQTLELIGQSIFKHWFVDFEFPDENGNPYKSSGGEMIDSELGEIPKGWKIGTISDLCSSITNGGTPKRNIESYWNNGEIPWYKTGELSDNPLLDSEEHINQNGLENSSCKLWEPNTILIALYASPTVGRLGILKTNATSNQACSGLIAKNDVGYQYLFYTLLFKRNELNSIAVGSAQQNISQDIIKNTKALIPTSKNTKKFQELLEPLFEMRTLLLNEANNLSKIRDSLLPKLISGKIRVNISEEAIVKIPEEVLAK